MVDLLESDRPYFDTATTWWVCPIVLLRPGKAHGVRRADVRLPGTEILKTFWGANWSKTPLCLDHPEVIRTDFGVVGNREWLRDAGIGEVRHPWFRDGILGAQAWFDLERMYDASRTLYRRLMAGERLPVSVGMYVRRRPASNRRHDGATRFRPDHVAILLEGTGAIAGACIEAGSYMD